MSYSLRPHRQQPTRLCHPWDSPGKNTGVGCHFLFQCMKVKSKSEVAWSCPTLRDPMDCSPPGSSIHGIFQEIPGKSYWSGVPLPSPYHSLLLVNITLKVKVAQSCLTLCNPWNSPGQIARVDSCSLLQGIFPTQRSNPGLPHCRQILYQLSHQGNPRTLEWVVYPFSSGSSRPRNRTGVFCIVGRFFTN